jgi:hypothetical protein
MYTLDIVMILVLPVAHLPQLAASVTLAGCDLASGQPGQNLHVRARELISERERL